MQPQLIVDTYSYGSLTGHLPEIGLTTAFPQHGLLCAEATIRRGRVTSITAIIEVLFSPSSLILLTFPRRWHMIFSCRCRRRRRQ